MSGIQQSVRHRIDEQYDAHYRATGTAPRYVYLSEGFAKELDEQAGMLVFSYRNMDIVIVDKREFVGVGDKYTVDKCMTTK